MEPGEWDNRRAEPKPDEPDELEVQRSQMSGTAGKPRQVQWDQMILRMMEAS